MFSHIHYINVNLVDLKDKGQGEVHTRTDHVGPEGEQNYSSTFSLTSELDVGGWSSCSSCSTPGKETQCPWHKRLGGPMARLDGCRKSQPQLGFDPWTIQNTASHYTGYAILDYQLGGLTIYFHHRD